MYVIIFTQITRFTSSRKHLLPLVIQNIGFRFVRLVIVPGSSFW